MSTVASFVQSRLAGTGAFVCERFDKGFGPGYNCESGLLSVKNRTKLLLSKPTATLHGDSTGAPHSRCSPGSCVYRRNLTIAESDDGGASWAVRPWGLVYADRVAYTAMAELPDGNIAVVFERGTAASEYRYLSVAVAGACEVPTFVFNCRLAWVALAPIRSKALSFALEFA